MEQKCPRSISKNRDFSLTILLEGMFSEIGDEIMSNISYFEHIFNGHKT